MLITLFIINIFTLFFDQSSYKKFSTVGTYDANFQCLTFKWHQMNENIWKCFLLKKTCAQLSSMENYEGKDEEALKEHAFSTLQLE